MRHPLLPSLAALVIAFLYAPIVILVLFAFNDSAFTYSWTRFTLRWFVELSGDRLLIAWRNTFFVSLGVVVLATSVGTLAAYSLLKYSFRAKALIIILLFVPIIIPRTNIGIAALLFLHYLGIPRSLFTVGIWQAFYVLPFVIIAVTSALMTFDRRLEEAAMDLGAGPFYTFRKVTFPLIANGVATGAAVAFILAFGEFTISFYLAGSEHTLPLFIYSEFRHLMTPMINAHSTIVIVIVIVTTLLTEYMRKRSVLSGRSEKTLEITQAAIKVGS